jgi:hypothetical protein
MEITSENLGGKEILVDVIRELAQIYRFDEFRVSLKDGDRCVQFDVPSTEWLEYFTGVLKSQDPREFRQTLRSSGWWFHVSRKATGVTLFVFDIKQGRHLTVELSFDEAKMLHGVVLESILQPFIEQGGKVDDLEDLESFYIPNAHATS